MRSLLDKRICRYCGGEFTPTVANQVFCSVEHKKLYGKFHNLITAYHRVCPCGKSFITTRSNQFYCCDKHSKVYGHGGSSSIEIRGEYNEQ